MHPASANPAICKPGIVVSYITHPENIDVTSLEISRRSRWLLAAVATRIIVVTSLAVNRAVCQVAVVLCVHGHLIVGGTNGREAVLLVLRAGGRKEINDET